jgi:hypothetical protein
LGGLIILKIQAIVTLVLSLLSTLALAGEDELLQRINSLEGVTAIETTSIVEQTEGVRKFAVQIEQPVDHFDPKAGTFQQKLVLFHRDYEEPMVLQTSGYAIFSESLSRLARNFATNQIQVEHRYFQTSTPVGKDWSKLTVRQSAEDFHRVVEKFKKLYPGHWVNTGGSKGGMTSIYHRRFHPEDLDGTLADVAPMSFGTDDSRYIGFLDQVGGPGYTDCRSKLEAFQRTVLEKREEILPTVSGVFTILGSKEVAYEHATLELPFVFWQYGSPTSASMGCNQVPEITAPVEALANYLHSVNSPSDYSDSTLAQFRSYFYQAGAELGAPGTKLIHLADLLQYPYTLDQYLPVPVVYNGSTMLDVQKWISEESRGILFIYGEYDPWTAGAYQNIHAGSDNHFYVVPKANHGANYADLPAAQKAEATAILARWLGKSPLVSPIVGAQREFLEDIELKIRRKFRL